MNEDYNLEKVRMLLDEGFNAGELRNLCFDRLKPVYDESESATKSDLIRRIVDYADKQHAIEAVLDWARTKNPYMYEQCGPYKNVDGRPSSSPPVHKPDSGGPRTTKIAMIVAVFLLILAIMFVVYHLLTEATTPNPQAKISSPIDGQNVSTNPEVVVEYNNIPTDRYLWVAVRIPKVRPAGLIYPQLKDGKLPPHLVGTGIYKTYAALGAKEDIGAPFNIVILLADQEANAQIMAYAKACGFNPDSCKGMPLPETGVEILDFITVIRQ